MGIYSFDLFFPLLYGQHWICALYHRHLFIHSPPKKRCCTCYINQNCFYYYFVYSWLSRWKEMKRKYLCNIWQCSTRWWLAGQHSHDIFSACLVVPSSLHEMILLLHALWRKMYCFNYVGLSFSLHQYCSYVILLLAVWKNIYRLYRALLVLYTYFALSMLNINMQYSNCSGT